MPFPRQQPASSSTDPESAREPKGPAGRPQGVKQNDKVKRQAKAPSDSMTIDSSRSKTYRRKTHATVLANQCWLRGLEARCAVQPGGKRWNKQHFLAWGFN